MRSTIRIVPLVLLFVACAGPATNDVRETSAAAGTLPMPTLPWGGGTGAASPWGGSDPRNWRPEAVIANAASEALNGAWARAAVREAIVAMPVRMLPSDFFEFG